MALLTCKDIHYTVGDRHLLRGVSLVVGAGDRIGMLGSNGCGKSTLLRILVGELQQDSGERTMRRQLRLGYLPQEPLIDPAVTAREAVAAGLATRNDVLLGLQQVHEELADQEVPARRLEQLLDRQDRLEQELERLGGHDVEHRIAAMLDQLGIHQLEQPCGSMSGGELRRVALARLLLSAPELLLLDEPTNHLDAEVTARLEGLLAERDVPLVLVTHDRYFLDRLASRIVEVEHGLLHEYEGGYRDFLVKRAERLDRVAATERTRCNLLRRETEWMKRGPPARTTKAKARIGRYDALVGAAPPDTGIELEFRLPEGPRLGDRVVEARGLSKAFEGRSILAGLDLEIGPGSRVGIVGRNGVGKTTLLRLLTGELQPDQGSVSVGSTVEFAAIDQGRTDLDPDKTVLEEIGRGNDYVAVGGRALRIETFLEQFLFPGQRKHGRVATLSGGERSRLLLAKMLCRGGNVLVFDEPTNDLDLMSLRSLEEALLAFPGAVLVVSHDRWFLDRIATDIVYLDGSGRVRLHPGDLSGLLDKLARERAGSPVTARKAPRKSVAPAAELSPRPRKLSTREQQELEELPQRIQDAEQELAEIDRQLSDPGLYTDAGRGQQRDRLAARRQALPAETAALYERWQELESIAEQARQARG